MTQSTEFAFVRHGRPDIKRDLPAATWNLHDDAQADIQLLAQALPPASVIVTSDEPKAEQTAQIIQGVVGADLRVDRRLREVSRPDEWIDDYEARGARYLARGHEPDWEPADQVVARMNEATGDLPAGTIVVGHGLSLTLYTATLAEFDHVAFWRDLRLPDAWLATQGTPPRRVEPAAMLGGSHLETRDRDRPAGVEPRRTGRVILIDGGARVLLFRVNDDDKHFWITPGGRAAPDETPREAACRELEEEVGLQLEPSQLGPPVAHTDGPFTWRGRSYWGHDTFFVVQVDVLEVDTSGFSALERTVVTTHRWWPLDEISKTRDVIYPAHLAPLVHGLLDDGPPDSPIRLPWS